MKTLLAALVLAVLATAPVAANVDRKDPAAVARAFLTAFQAEDLAAVAALINDRNRAFFEDIVSVGPSHPRWDSVFSGWRADAARGWTGALGAARYRGEEALVPFAALGGDELAVVVLTEDPRGWGVEDIHSPSRADVERLPITR